MNSLHEAVARAIAAEQLAWYALDREPDTDGDLPDALAAAAITVVLGAAEKATFAAFSYEATHNDQARGWALRRAVGALRGLGGDA